MANTMNINELKQELKAKLIDSLSLDDVNVEDISNEEPLFGDGLGLDSLDAVEIVVMLQRNYNIEVKDMEKGRTVFYSIDTLAKFIQENLEN